MGQKRGYVYILANKHNTVFYVGVTSDLKKRVWQYKNKVVDGFTKKYQLNRFIYFENFGLIEEAVRREKYIKGKGRSFKKKLIEKISPDYEDLY
ncbi:MAG: GIY-YIG nuclease family protein [Patescibacteria group bacterium]|nr:GIY-YIG nuclease family protein [Patescibacteria group bacterium]